MTWMTGHLWLIPLLPLLAAGLGALLPRQQRRPAAILALGGLGLAFLGSCLAFGATLGAGAERVEHNFTWFELGRQAVRAGWLLDPLSAAMLVMVTFVGFLIFVFSLGYMAGDPNLTRFLCFLSLFASAMLGLLLANSLLVLFMCWEVVGLASYLLIGFWFQKPSAAAAARKAFLTTRVGDLGFLLGMVWLYHETGTLLFYDGGAGCLEQTALTRLVTQATAGGMLLSTGISLLILCGAVGKSGQVPLHVWLPDAMEGPTPVSALIHAATMVAAGVFLVARMYPLFAALPPPAGGGAVAGAAASAAVSPALQVVTWLGAGTAVFAALIAVAQTDIKRILAYSTVSQLGFMFLGLGVGGPAVGMFHLLTHAFFKALLFLGAGSVIHGCHHEQDIRHLGGLRRSMPVTFATYAVGMMALSGVPLVFSGFWSKDEILHQAMAWGPSKGPFVLAVVGAFLTAFYMTRQMKLVFFGHYRGGHGHHGHGHGHGHGHDHGHGTVHESPRVMTVPLMVLAAATVLLTVVSTPAWPWLPHYLEGHRDTAGGGHGGEGLGGLIGVLLLSTVLVAAGIGLGMLVYQRYLAGSGPDRDPLEKWQPGVFGVLRRRLLVDELYEATVGRLAGWMADTADLLDRFVWAMLVEWTALIGRALAWLSRAFDDGVINPGFDAGCETARGAGAVVSRLQAGQAQRYLRWLAGGVAALVVILAWTAKK